MTPSRTPSATPSGRLPWVEIARLLATLSVIMQHVPGGGFPPNHWLIGPALAVFFLLAGYFSVRTDDKLADLYEYHTGRDKIEQAFEILKENHLNVFRDR